MLEAIADIVNRILEQKSKNCRYETVSLSVWVALKCIGSHNFYKISNSSIM